MVQKLYLIIYYDNPDDAKETEKIILDQGGKVISIQGDVTKPDSVKNIDIILLKIARVR